MTNLNDTAVYVIGAGASAEFNLPTGDGLKRQIAQELGSAHVEYATWAGPERALGNALAKAAGSLNVSLGAMQEAVSLIARAMLQVESIDNFLHMHRGDKAVEIAGKLAIVKVICDAERALAVWHRKKRPLAATARSALPKLKGRGRIDLCSSFARAAALTNLRSGFNSWCSWSLTMTAALSTSSITASKTFMGAHWGPNALPTWSADCGSTTRMEPSDPSNGWQQRRLRLHSVLLQDRKNSSNSLARSRHSRRAPTRTQARFLN